MEWRKATLDVRLYRLFDRFPNGWGGRNRWEEFHFLLGALVRGNVRLKLERIPAEICAKAFSRHHFVSTRGESAEHAYVKAVGAEWLIAKGGHDAEQEAYVNGRTDAYTEDLKWFVECRHTAVRKLHEAISEWPDSHFTLIPFQNRYGQLYGDPHIQSARSPSNGRRAIPRPRRNRMKRIGPPPPHQ